MATRTLLGARTQAPPSSIWTRPRAPEARLRSPDRALPRPLSGHDLGKISVLPSAPARPQAKLTVGRPGDAYEVEADRIADRVMAAPAPPEGAVSTGRTQEPSIQRACAACEEEPDKQMQAKEAPGAAPTASPALLASLPALRTGGEPLSESARAFFEPRFGYDFSAVRVHADARASDSAREARALAYTVGRDIVFRQGQYAPDTPSGKRLLAHELTHVVQQAPTLRRTAEPAAAVALASGPALQRTPGDDDPAPTTGEAEPMKEDPTTEPSCPVQATGTVSKTSWGETSGVYPTKSTTAPTESEKYNPSKWDAAKVCDLLKARAAVHEVGGRGQSVHKASPGDSAIEKALKPYHFTESFPTVDTEIKDDAGVKWFYLGATATTMHTGIKNPTLVKSYGPFFNNGGGDVAKGTVYINFFKTS